MSRRLDAIRSQLPISLASQVESGADFARRQQPHLRQQDSFCRLLDTDLPRRQVIELVGRRSSGRFSLVLDLLAASTSSGESAVLVDLGDGFDPDNALRAGVELERLLWVRPRRTRDAMVGTEIVLGSSFPLVVLELGLSPSGASSLGNVWQRLAREVRNREAVLLVSTPWRVSGAAARTVFDLDLGRPHWRGLGSTSRWLAGLQGQLAVRKQPGHPPRQASGFRLMEPTAGAAVRPLPIASRPVSLATASSQ